MNPFNSLITRWQNRRRDRAEGEASRRQVIQSIETAREKQAFFSILGRLGNLAITLISFIANENTRHNNEVFTAWQTITSANDQTR